MHRQLVFAAITCLSATGCAKDSALVEGDPFLHSTGSPYVAGSTTTTTAHAPADSNSGPTEVTTDPQGRIGVDFDFSQPNTGASLDPEPWPAASPATDAAQQAGVQIPAGAGNQRDRHFSVNYGVGTRIR